jgi:hypothetical protein
MLRILAIGVGLLFATASLASAQPTTVNDLVKQVEAQSQSTVEAVEMLRKAMIIVSEKGKFTFRKALFVQAPPQGFGIYTPRKDNVFKIGEKIYVYIEPVGLTWKKQDGFYRTFATIDYEVRTPEGKVVLGQRNAGKIDLRSREQNQEVMFQFTLGLSGARPGKLIVAATYRDTESGETAGFELPFELK